MVIYESICSKNVTLHTKKMLASFSLPRLPRNLTITPNIPHFFFKITSEVFNFFSAKIPITFHNKVSIFPENVP